MNNKYFGVAIALGVGMGAAVGAAEHNMGRWVALGAAFGMVLALVLGAMERSRTKRLASRSCATQR
jgi:predicted outer membrane lipoprotein